MLLPGLAEILTVPPNFSKLLPPPLPLSLSLPPLLSVPFSHLNKGLGRCLGPERISQSPPLPPGDPRVLSPAQLLSGFEQS